MSLQRAAKKSSGLAVDLLAAGGGEMGRRVREFDWAATPLGAAEGWPASLTTAVLLMLTSRYPMLIWWGAELTQIYNDAYAGMTLGTRHPWALGRSGPEVFPDIWDDLGPRVDSVFRTGQATWDEELLLILERGGRREETYHTFSYSPIPDDGEVGGILCPVIENTQAVLGRRRLTTLRELAARTNEEARSADDACRAAIGILAGNPHDLPFVLIYLLDAEAKSARLAGATGLAAGTTAAPATLDLTGAAPTGWPLQAVLASGRAEVVTDLERRWGALPGGVWPEPPQAAVVLPVTRSGQDRLAGFLVAGASPRSPLDDGYRGFFDLLANPIATAVANAHAYEEVARAEMALQQANRRKDEFLATLAHELRNPLAPMRNGLHILRLSSTTGEDATPIHAMMERQVGHMVRLVDDLLEMSRITRGKIELRKELVELGAVLRSAVETSKPLIEAAGHRLELTLPPEPLLLDADAVRLAQIFANLLDNAAKYTDPGGSIRVGAESRGDRVEVSVRDSGTGIPADMLPHVFDLFTQGHQSAGRVEGGLGIGLTLVQSLVQMHGGSVEARSEGAGKGSEFVVRLPLSADPPARPANDEAGPAVALACRVLVVDDNRDAANSLGTLLRLLGADVRVAYDGPSALAELEDFAAAAVVLDLGMPGMDGCEVARRIRQHPRSHDATLIALTGWGQEEDRRRSRRAGFDHHLIKPADVNALLALLAAVPCR